jgi:multidrug efflux system membrane fusion protein
MFSMNRFGRRASISLLIALPATVALLWSVGAGRSAAAPPAAAPAAPAVTVADVIHKPLREWEEFTGRLEPVSTVELRPRVSGYIDRVAFGDGARVQKGQLLFQIDPRPFEAEAQRLRAERDRAVSDLALARANYARAERLIGANAIAREEYDRLAAEQKSAGAALDAANGALESAELNLEFTQVRAPISGRVSRALITSGNLVGGDSVLTTIVSDNPVYAYFDADEQTYLRYSSHRGGGADGVFMGLVDETGYPHAGRLDFVDNRVNAATGTIRVRAVFDNPDGRFTPGLFARVRLVGGDETDTVLIEDRAVGTDLGKNFVLALTPDNKVEYRGVELGPEIDGLRVVAKGLAPGDVIVVNGLQHVRPGMQVEPQRVAMDEGNAGLSQVAAAPAPRHLVVSAGVAGAAAALR